MSNLPPPGLLPQGSSLPCAYYQQEWPSLAQWRAGWGGGGEAVMAETGHVPAELYFLGVFSCLSWAGGFPFMWPWDLTVPL